MEEMGFRHPLRQHSFEVESCRGDGVGGLIAKPQFPGQAELQGAQADDTVAAGEVYGSRCRLQLRQLLQQEASARVETLTAEDIGQRTQRGTQRLAEVTAEGLRHGPCRLRSALRPPGMGLVAPAQSVAGADVAADETVHPGRQVLVHSRRQQRGPGGQDPGKLCQLVFQQRFLLRDPQQCQCRARGGEVGTPDQRRRRAVVGSGILRQRAGCKGRIRPQGAGSTRGDQGQGQGTVVVVDNERGSRQGLFGNRIQQQQIGPAPGPQQLLFAGGITLQLERSERSLANVRGAGISRRGHTWSTAGPDRSCPED